MRTSTIFMVALAGGVALAAPPAFGRDKPVSGIPCPAMPPAANTISSRDGTVGLQMFGVGISGNRAGTKAESDVIIQSAGVDAWLDAVQFKQACEIIRQRHPGDAARQLEEMMRFRNSQRPPEPVQRTTLPVIDLTPEQPVTPVAPTAPVTPARTNQKPTISVDFGKAVSIAFGTPTKSSPVQADAAQNADSEPATIAGINPLFAAEQQAEPVEQPRRSVAPVDFSYSRGCTTSPMLSGDTGLIQSCSGSTTSGGKTTCVSTPQTSQMPGFMFGTVVIGGTSTTTWSRSCSTTF